LKAGKMVFTPRLSVGYAWDLSNTARNLTAQFQAAQTASFSVVGTPAPGSWWNLGLGFDLAINQRTSLYADTRGQLSPGSTQAINYNGGIRWRF
jgi:outer membrane autotransporter protein